MTSSYLLLALGIALLINLGNRWARIMGQSLAAIALFFNIWSIWLAIEDGTFAAAGAQGGQVLALKAMAVGASFTSVTDTVNCFSKLKLPLSVTRMRTL